MRPHPAVQILLWLSFTVMLQRLPLLPLGGISLLMLVLTLKLCANQWLRLLKRTRWIMLSLLIIYAYSTPGTALIATWGVYAPTLEGLMDGALQLLRLLVILASLAMLLSWLDRDQFIGGIYTLAYPLRWFGISRERAAVRLALTLHYAEPTMGEAAVDWRGAIYRALEMPTVKMGQVELPQPHWRAIDGIGLIGCAAMLWLGVR